MRKDDYANSAMADEPYCRELSALLDGECQVTARVLHDAATSTVCREKWESYHLIRDVMQNECRSSLPSNFVSLVSAKIAMEDNIAGTDANDRSSQVIALDRSASNGVTRSSARRRGPAGIKRLTQPHAPRWLPFAGLGLAASVAVAGLFGWQVVSQFNGSAVSQGTSVAQLSAPRVESSLAEPSVVPEADSGLVRAVFRPDGGTRWVTDAGPEAVNSNARVAQRLNALLLNHMEDASMSRVQGMVVHTRLVGYDTGSVDGSF